MPEAMRAPNGVSKEAENASGAATDRSTAEDEWNDAVPAIATAVTAASELPAATRCGNAVKRTSAGMANTAPPMPHMAPSVPEARPMDSDLDDGVIDTTERAAPTAAAAVDAVAGGAVGEGWRTCVCGDAKYSRGWDSDACNWSRLGRVDEPWRTVCVVWWVRRNKVTERRAACMMWSVVGRER